MSKQNTLTAKRHRSALRAGRKAEAAKAMPFAGVVKPRKINKYGSQRNELPDTEQERGD